MYPEGIPVVRAAQMQDILAAALQYAELGFSVLPLKGKASALKSWAQYQVAAASFDTIHAWQRAGVLQNVGIVCGAVSGNLVVLDLDGPAGYPAFAATFPRLAETFTVATGGGVGQHVYLFADTLPPTARAMQTPLGHLELRANGCQVVAPPSVHPETGKPYTVLKAADILRVADLRDLVAWIEAFKPRPTPSTWRPPTNLPSSPTDLNPRVVQTLAEHFRAQGFRQYGDWLHGPCIYPERHAHGDRHPSFGFNTATGYGHCFVCGTLLAKDICAQVGIDPAAHGGLLDVPEHIAPILLEPPNEPKKTPRPAPKLPAWLEQYVAWASTTGYTLDEITARHGWTRHRGVTLMRTLRTVFYTELTGQPKIGYLGTHHPLSAAEKQRIRALYAGDLSYRQVTARVGRSAAAVEGLCKRYPPGLVARVRALRAQGLSYRKIARRVRRSKSYVGWLLQATGSGDDLAAVTVGA